MAKPRRYPVEDITVPEKCDGCPFPPGEVAAGGHISGTGSENLNFAGPLSSLPRPWCPRQDSNQHASRQ